MRASRISWLLLALFVANAARAQDIPLDARRRLLLRGAYGVAGGLALAVFSAGLGAALAYGACRDEETGVCSDPNAAKGGAFAGLVIGYQLGVGIVVPGEYAEEGKKQQLRGRKGWVTFAVVATSLATLTATVWSMAHYSDRGAAVLAPLGTAGVLSMMVAPWGLGYVAYRGSHRRAMERPIIEPTLLGMRARF